MAELKELREAIKELSKANKHVNDTFSSLDKNNLVEVLKAYKSLDECVDILEQITKCLNSLHQDMSYKIIPELFQANEIESAKIAGRNFIVNYRTNASIPFDMQESGFKWLKENGLGSLIKDGVNSKSLSSAMNSYFDEHAKWPPEDAIKVHKQPYTSIRKT